MLPRQLMLLLLLLLRENQHEIDSFGKMGLMLAAALLTISVFVGWMHRLLLPLLLQKKKKACFISWEPEKELEGKEQAQQGSNFVQHQKNARKERKGDHHCLHTSKKL